MSFDIKHKTNQNDDVFVVSEWHLSYDNVSEVKPDDQFAK